MKKHFLIIALGLSFLTIPFFSSADERHFGYSYESDVMPDGGKDFEVYNTFRYGRDHFYSGWDQSLEFEIGLKGNISTSLYLNYTQTLEGDVSPVNSPQFNGIANEWRFKLSDSLIDPIGFGLLCESEFKPDEIELETKVVLDKRTGDFLWTFNWATEPEYHLVDGTWGLTLTPSLGIGLFTSNHFLIGLESEMRNFLTNSQPSQPIRQTASIFSLGPDISYTANGWWVTLTVLPQVANLMGGDLDFTNTDTGSQKWQVRLGASIHLNTFTPSNTTLPEPTEESASQASQKWPGTTLANLQDGKHLYLQNCMACHNLHSPSEFTPERWGDILEKMQQKARIDDPTKDLILRYLVVTSSERIGE